MGLGCPGEGLAAVAGVAEGVLFAGKMYSDSICAACSGVGCGLVAEEVRSFLPQLQKTHAHKATKMNACFISTLSK